MRVRSDYSDYSPTKWAVYRYDLATGAVRRLADGAFTVGAAPREPLIVVGKHVDGNQDLYVLDEAGRELARLTTDPAEDAGGAFSPDGRTIAFYSKRAGRAQVYLADRDGANPRLLVDAGPDRTYNPTWSPDGRWIAYYREKGDGKDQVHVIHPDGTGDVNVTQDEHNNIFPGWTPDGRVVYGRGTRGVPTLAYTVGVDGSGKAPLHGLRSFFTRFSPDGSRMAYVEERVEPRGVRLMVAASTGAAGVAVPLDSVGSP
jgi:TolB protein